MPHRIPSINIQAFVGMNETEECLFDIRLDESSVTTTKLQNVLPQLHSAVTILYDWIAYATKVRDEMVTTKARGLVNEEKYGKQVA